MDTATAAVIVSGMALAATIITTVFGSGWKVAGRLTSIETSVVTMQADLTALREVLVRMADLKGDMKVLDARVTSLDTRVTTHGKKIDDLSRGVGFVRAQRASIDGEYP